MRLNQSETLERVTEKIDKLTLFGGLEGVMQQLVRRKYAIPLRGPRMDRVRFLSAQSLKKYSNAHKPRPIAYSSQVRSTK